MASGEVVFHINHPGRVKAHVSIFKIIPVLRRAMPKRNVTSSNCIVPIIIILRENGTLF